MEELKIGVVAEGISDYWVVKHIVERFLKNKGAYTVPLQPKISPNDRQFGEGGWNKVFTYISNKEYIIDSAQTEDCNYIVVQIDTDVCNEYGVNKNVTPEILYENVLAKILEKTHDSFDKTKIIPAICIHSIECWLIPFVANDEKKSSKTDNCVNALNREIRTVGTIDNNNKGEAVRQGLYGYILDKKKKTREIEVVAHYNYGFSKFIESLSTV